MYCVMQAMDPVGQPLIRLQRIDSYTESWMSGARFDSTRLPPNPLRMRYHPETQGTFLRDLYEAPVCLMSKRLVTALQAGGVDNLDLYPVEILDEKLGKRHKTHFAVNIVGKIAATDVAGTAFNSGVPERMISAAIDTLLLDERAARGQLLFRLAESVDAIVVHESVREVVEASKLGSLQFLKPAEWSSL